VIAVLEHFDAATRMLSADCMLLLHLIYPKKVQLAKKLQARDAKELAVTLNLDSAANWMLCFMLNRCTVW